MDLLAHTDGVPLCHLAEVLRVAGFSALLEPPLKYLWVGLEPPEFCPLPYIEFRRFNAHHSNDWVPPVSKILG